MQLSPTAAPKYHSHVSVHLKVINQIMSDSVICTGYYRDSSVRKSAGHTNKTDCIWRQRNTHSVDLCVFGAHRCSSRR